MARESRQESGLEQIADDLRQALEAKNAAREEALRSSREIIRACSMGIRAIHRHEFGEAENLLAGIREKVAQLKGRLAGHPDIYHAGYMQDAQKEAAEAEILFALVRGRPFPPARALGIEPAAYLNGLGEAASECRRHLLDLLRAGDVEQADRLLGAMDEIYHELVTFDYPDAITGGLRRTTDLVRGVLERTRGDLTLTITQRQLERALDQAVASIQPVPPPL